MTCLQTYDLFAYDNLLHPATKTADGKYVPDFNFRYIREDDSYGMIVSRQIADFVGVETPVIDEIVLCAQEKLVKKSLFIESYLYLTGSTIEF
jgi:hypothetical protein